MRERTETIEKPRFMVAPGGEGFLISRLPQTFADLTAYRKERDLSILCQISNCSIAAEDHEYHCTNHPILLRFVVRGTHGQPAAGQAE